MIEIDEEKASPEVIELLKEYNIHAQEVRDALYDRDIAMLNIIAKTKLPFNDFIKKVIK